MTRIGAAREFGSRMAWLAPMIAFLAVFMVLPLFDVVRLSFTTASIIEPEYSYTLRSYARVFGDKDFLWSLSIEALAKFGEAGGFLEERTDGG